MGGTEVGVPTTKFEQRILSNDPTTNYVTGGVMNGGRLSSSFRWVSRRLVNARAARNLGRRRSSFSRLQPDRTHDELACWRCADGSGLDLAKHWEFSDRAPARPRAGCSRSRRYSAARPGLGSRKAPGPLAGTLFAVPPWTGLRVMRSGIGRDDGRHPSGRH
jgi:hypothetical protein